MEGPSLVIAREEFQPFLGKKMDRVTGSAKAWTVLKGQKLKSVKTWGKHFLLIFQDTTLRIHFLMFGSYRIDDPRKNRIPKLQLTVGDHEIYFYSCAIKQIEGPLRSAYDWSVDPMSPQWDAKRARKKLKQKPLAQVCDLLMDQSIFSGVGNIMKNEILFRMRLQPQSLVHALSAAERNRLVREAETYSWQFYAWKKVGQLKRNWQIFRKKNCPRCEKKVTKRSTGKLERSSFFCSRCQVLKKA